MLGPQPARERTRHPSLEYLIWKELRAFLDGTPAYAELRASWSELCDRSEREALDALAQRVAIRLSVGKVVVIPLVSQMMIRL